MKALGSYRPTTAIAKFGALFVGFTVLFFLLFHRFTDLVASIYLMPASHIVSYILYGIGVRAEVALDPGGEACILQIGQVSYGITQGCTGLFTSAIFISIILAYPVSAREKLAGLLIGIPAFFAFGVLRIVIMGIVAVVKPSHIELFHVYIMAIANLGFAIFVWLHWLNRIVDRERFGPVSN